MTLISYFKKTSEFEKLQILVFDFFNHLLYTKCLPWTSPSKYKGLYAKYFSSEIIFLF